MGSALTERTGCCLRRGKTCFFRNYERKHHSGLTNIPAAKREKDNSLRLLAGHVIAFPPVSGGSGLAHAKPAPCILAPSPKAFYGVAPTGNKTRKEGMAPRGERGRNPLLHPIGSASSREGVVRFSLHHYGIRLCDRPKKVYRSRTLLFSF